MGIKGVMREKTFGLIQEKILDPRDWHFGGISGIVNEVLVADGQWDIWLPPLELQATSDLETMACVSFACANAIETLLNRKYNADINYSDRALAKMSGTKRTGNEMSVVANTARELGLILERYWYFDRQAIKTWEDFYCEIPAETLAKAKDFLYEYDLTWEWVYSSDPEKIKEALKYAPLAVAIYAYTAQDANGYYTRKEAWPNHLVLLYGYEDGKCWKIYDQYKNCYKNLAWDFNLGAKIKFNITLKSEKPMSKYTFENNTLLQLVEGSGGFGLYLDGKIIVDELDKVLASWLVRNNGNTTNKVRAVTQEVWDSFPKISLKKEVL